MTRMIRLQPAARIDAISEDGHVGYQLPYPFYADEYGKISNQDFWQGNPYAVIGFQRDLARQTIDLWWRDVPDHPESTVGMYLVTMDKNGTWSTHYTAIESASSFSDGPLV